MIQKLLLSLCLCSGILAAQETAAAQAGQARTAQVGTLQGSVADSTRAPIPDANVMVVASSPANSAEMRTTTDASGAFALENVSSGPVIVTISAPGFANLRLPAMLPVGKVMQLGTLTLTIAPASSRVEVTVTNKEIATEQIREAETQRLFGVIPNFLVTYRPDAVPLTAKQKFALTSRFTLDPSAFVIAGAIAGAEQAADGFSGYGQGAQGYGKRYGAAYADFAISNVLSSAVLPALFRQDPRYFVKGEGTVRSRVLYALANAVVRKSDNRRWQPDYSGILGNLGAGGISNLYYPSTNRNGAALTFENAAIGIAAGAAANVLQEFVLKRLTPKAPKKVAQVP